jgi:hypothetical protein
LNKVSVDIVETKIEEIIVKKEKETEPEKDAENDEDFDDGEAPDEEAN